MDESFNAEMSRIRNDSKAFEEYCCFVLSTKYAQEHPNGFLLYGKTGQSQHGIDIYSQSIPGRKHIVAQCKCYEKTRNDLRTSIRNSYAKFRESEWQKKTDKYIIMLATDNDAKISDFASHNAAQDGLEIIVIFWDELYNFAKNKYSKEKEHAATAMDTAKQNARLELTSAQDAALRVYNDAIANARRTREDTIANAERTLQDTIANAERTLQDAMANAERTLQDAMANARGACWDAINTAEANYNKAVESYNHRFFDNTPYEKTKYYTADSAPNKQGR